MGRASAGTTHGLQCPDCATDLELAPEDSHGVLRLFCPAAGAASVPHFGAWAQFCLREASWLIEPVARGQEARADRMAAIIAGGGAAASALVKVAVVQPLFREVLEHYDPNHPNFPNLYSFFRTFWYRLPVESVSAMRLQVLTSQHARPRASPPARSPRADPGVCQPGLRQR